MKFEIYREKAHAPGDWRWRLKAANGRIVAEGGEGYKRATTLVRTVERHIVRDSAHLGEALERACMRAGLRPNGEVRK